MGRVDESRSCWVSLKVAGSQTAVAIAAQPMQLTGPDVVRTGDINTGSVSAGMSWICRW